MRLYVALGTNQGDLADNLRRAAAALGRLPGTAVAALSPVYETDPVGYADQPCFYNAVAAVDTALSPRALLGACLGIEAAMGRVRTVSNGPRVIDLDLVWGEAPPCADAELTFPHPRLTERAFVLVPLCDICPDDAPRAALRKRGAAGVRPTDVRWTL